MFILIGIPLFRSFNPVFPLRLNSKPSPDFTVFWVLSSIKALIRHEIREVKLTICLLNSNEFSKTSLCKTAPVADKTTVVEYNVYRSYPYISFLNQICVFNILSIHTLGGFSRCPLPAERESYACSLRHLYHHYHHHYHYINHYRCRYRYRKLYH